MIRQLIVDTLHKLKKVGDLCTVGRSELLVELYDNPQAHQHVLLILELQQFECQREDVLGIWLQLIIGRKPLDHFQNQFPHLLDVQLGDEVTGALLEQLQEDAHRVVQERLVLRVPDDHIEAVVELLGSLQLAFIFSLAVAQDVQIAAHKIYSHNILTKSRALC